MTFSSDALPLSFRRLVGARPTRFMLRSEAILYYTILLILELKNEVRTMNYGLRTKQY